MGLAALYAAYFSNLRTIASIAIPFLSLLVFYAVFRRSDSPKARSWSLGLMLLSSVFLWLFVALSLVFCYAWSEAYEYELEAGVRAVFGRTLIISILAGLPLSFMLRQVSPRIILGKVKGLTAPPEQIAESFSSLAEQMGVPTAKLRLSTGKMPISFAAQTGEPIVVVSENLLSLLKKDELDAVMAHELAHIKNSDTALKAMVTAYRTALPYDPIIRLVESAFHREREMVADETAAKTTRKPLSLASALLKIYEAFPRNDLPSHGTLSILGAGSSLLSRHPPLRQRINQLIRLADIYS